MYGTQKQKSKMQSDKRKTTIYLKSTDKDNIPQIQKEVNLLIKQEFLDSDVYHTTTALIRAGINIMPSVNALLKLLEDARENLNPKITPDAIRYFKMHLRNKRAQESKSGTLKFKTPTPKAQRAAASQWSEGTDKTEDDSVELVDFDKLSFKEGLRRVLNESSSNLPVKDNDQEDEYIFQRLKEAAPKLTLKQISALVNYHMETEEVISMQLEAAHLIRKSIDSDFHSLLDLPHDNSSANDVQGSMYLKALIEAYHDLRPGASSVAYKEVQKVISTFGIGDKDQYFNPRNFSNKLQQTRGIYEMIFSLIGGVRESIKPVQDTAKELLHQIAQTEPRMLEFSLDKIQEIEQSSKDITLDQLMNAIVDRYARLQEAVGPAKVNPQPDKKKGEKSATANPAVMNGAKVQCQICGSEHNATECPQVKEALKQAAFKRGQLFPSQSDKDSKRRGTKDDSDDESPGEVCLICTKFNLCSQRAARSHTTEECKRVKDSIKKNLLENGNLSEKEDRPRRDKSKQIQQSVGVEQNYQQSTMMQNPGYEATPQGPRQFYGSPYQMQNQMWHQTMQQQQMRPEPQQMYGQYRPGGGPQTPRSANMSASVSSQGQMQGMMHEMEPILTFSEGHSPRGMHPQQYSQSSTPSTIKSARDSSDMAANMALTPSIMGMGAHSGAHKLTRMLGNYITDSQEERTYQQPHAMTARVSNQHGYTAMTATIVDQHPKEVTMLAQTGGNNHNSQKFFAQTQPS